MVSSFDVSLSTDSRSGSGRSSPTVLGPGPRSPGAPPNGRRVGGATTEGRPGRPSTPTLTSTVDGACVSIVGLPVASAAPPVFPTLGRASSAAPRRRRGVFACDPGPRRPGRSGRDRRPPPGVTARFEGRPTCSSRGGPSAGASTSPRSPSIPRGEGHPRVTGPTPRSETQGVRGLGAVGPSMSLLLKETSGFGVS